METPNRRAHRWPPRSAPIPSSHGRKLFAEPFTITPDAAAPAGQITTLKTLKKIVP
jgi:hypothetical protein